MRIADLARLQTGIAGKAQPHRQIESFRHQIV